MATEDRAREAINASAAILEIAVVELAEAQDVPPSRKAASNKSQYIKKAVHIVDGLFYALNKLIIFARTQAQRE